MPPRMLVIISALIELVTGLTVIALPDVAAKALLAAPIDPAGAAFIRLAGIALISLAVMGWSGRDGRPAFLGFLAYNALAAVYLVFLGLSFAITGAVLWPAAAVHAVLTVLMVMGLGRAGR
jgi:hypothetical protein